MSYTDPRILAYREYGESRTKSKKEEEEAAAEAAARLKQSKAIEEAIKREKIKEGYREYAKSRTAEKLVEPQEVYSRYQSGQITAKEAAEAIDEHLKNQGIEEKPLVTEAPEGMYYKSTEEVSEYNRQIIEYNRQVREYRLSLVEGITAPTPRPPAGYGTKAEAEPDMLQMVLGPPRGMGPPKTATPEDINRLRAEGWEIPDGQIIYINDAGEPYYYKPGEIGPPFTGPPAPLDAERLEALRRRKAGLETHLGIPGPAWGPKPSTVGAELQTRLYGGMEWMESGFQASTKGFRETGEQLRVMAPELKLEGRDLEAGVAFGVAGAFKAAEVVVDSATLPLRPLMISRTVKGIYDLATSEEARGRAVEQVRADPLGTAVSLPAAVLGARLFEAGVSRLVKAVSNLTPVEKVQLQSLTAEDISDVYTSKAGAGPVKTRLTPTVTKERGLMPRDIELNTVQNPDTLLGTAEGVGYKLTLESSQVKQLFKGKTIEVGMPRGEIVGLPDEYMPVAAMDTAKGTLGQPTYLKPIITTGKELYKELGAGTPYGPEAAKTLLKDVELFTMDVRGMAKLVEEVEMLKPKPPTGAVSPWNLKAALEEGKLFWQARAEAIKTAETTAAAMRSLGEGVKAPTVVIQSTAMKGVEAATYVTRPSSTVGWWLGGGAVLEEYTRSIPLPTQEPMIYTESKLRDLNVQIPDISQDVEPSTKMRTTLRMDPLTTPKNITAPVQTPIPIQTPIIIPVQIQIPTQIQEPAQTQEPVTIQQPIQDLKLWATRYQPSTYKTRLAVVPLPREREEKRRRRRGVFEERVLPLATEKQIMEAVLGKRKEKVKKI